MPPVRVGNFGIFTTAMVPVSARGLEERPERKVAPGLSAEGLRDASADALRITRDQSNFSR
jgi:hypothetical protein